MYFIIEGKIGIGFTLITKGMSQSHLIHSITNEGNSLIGDHYVMNK